MSLAGAGDQPRWVGIQLTHFEEKGGNDYSLDRLGRSCVDRKVIGYLRLRAENDAKKFHKSKRFDGWFCLVARELTKIKFEPQASPINGVELEENIYHAHVLRPDEVPPDLMAFRLRQLFVTRGKLEPVSSNQPSWRKNVEWFVNRLLEFLGIGSGS
jgi:hypothetical protein